MLYVRQVAWLDAAPAPKGKGKTKSTNKPMTRLEQITQAGRNPALPDAGPASHLVRYLFESGPTMAGGMSGAPLSHGEIAAWQLNTGIELTAWEARTIRRLSCEYLAVSQDAAEFDCPAPYVEQDARPEQRERIANRVSAIFGARAKQEKAH